VYTHSSIYRLDPIREQDDAHWCMSSKIVTIRDIALQVGVHHSTVSRALRRDRRLSGETIDRITAAAKALDYCPNPMLSALMAYRHQKSKKAFKSALGWITNYPTRDGWKQFEKTGYFRGAERRAESLGYQIDEVWLNEPGMTQRRATQVLLARNIQGLLFIPQPRSRAHLRLDWSKFSAVTFGHTMAIPVLHSVDSNHFRSMSTLMRQLKRLGYRRPGFACMPRIHESTDRKWLGAFTTYQALPINKQVPVFMKDPWTLAAFQKWYLRYRPDVVISHVEDVLSWMEAMGLKVPEDVGFALSAKHREFDPRCAGLDENSEVVGEQAVNVLVQMINRREVGIPETPISTQIEGKWVPGRTLRKMYL